MDVVGGGVLVAVAAALWIAYLLPNWFRRRQYEASERHAIRLQQTLRVLAETAETPEAVRLEATAREVVAQQRILAAQEQAAAHQAEAARLSAEAEAQLALAERRAAEEAVAAARERATRLALTQSMPAVAETASGNAAPAGPIGAAGGARRRGRALCSLALLVSTIVVVVGLLASWPVLAPLVAGAAGLLALSGLVRLARPTSAPVAHAAAPVVAAPVAAAFEPIELADRPARSAEWTPQPLPRPLHLSRGTIAATAMASVEAAAKLQRAVADEAMAAKAERLAPPVPVLRRPAAEPARPAASASRPTAAAEAATPNPYAAMGIVASAEPGFNDLDSVLRRRRAV